MQRGPEGRQLRVSMIGIAAVCFCGLAVAACGVRGSLEFPDAATAQPGAPATADAGQGKAPGATGKPHQSSILDRLIE
ncbi:MAG: lipoprotein [Pseudomonadota bacterium]